MSKLIKIIGSIVFTVAMYSVPILFTCSICLRWHGLLKLWFSVGVGLQIITVYFEVMEKVEDSER